MLNRGGMSGALLPIFAVGAPVRAHALGACELSAAFCCIVLQPVEFNVFYLFHIDSLFYGSSDLHKHPEFALVLHACAYVFG